MQFKLTAKKSGGKLRQFEEGITTSCLLVCSSTMDRYLESTRIVSLWLLNL